MSHTPSTNGNGVPHGSPCTGPLRRNVIVVNPRGLHLRTAERFSRAAKAFTSAISVWYGEKQADGRSPFDLFLLLAFPGSELVLEVSGPDAELAVNALADILADPGGEDYPSDMGDGI